MIIQGFFSHLRDSTGDLNTLKICTPLLNLTAFTGIHSVTIAVQCGFRASCGRKQVLERKVMIFL